MKDIQTASASFAGVTLDAESMEATLDRLRAPYAEGSITINGIVDIDEATPGRVLMSFDQRFATGLTAAQIAALFAPDDAATIAAGDWSGLTALQAAALYMRNLNGYYIPPTRAVLNLAVVSATQNLARRITTIRVASDEAVLIRGALVEAAGVSFGSLSVRTVASQVLALYGMSLAADGGADGTLDEVSVWTPGQKAWDFLSPIVEKTGLRLYCDERRIWHLVTMDAVLEGTVSLSTVTNVSEADPVVDFEAGGYDSVVCRYRWTNSADIEITRYDVAGANPGRNTYVKEYDDTVYPGPGAAAVLLARLSKRRKRLPLTAAADYSTRPTMRLTLSTPAGSSGGRVASVTFRYPAKQMGVEGYDFEDISARSVVAIPGSYTTADLPGSTGDLDPGEL